MFVKGLSKRHKYVTNMSIITYGTDMDLWYYFYLLKVKIWPNLDSEIMITNQKARNGLLMSLLKLSEFKRVN